MKKIMTSVINLCNYFLIKFYANDKVFGSARPDFFAKQKVSKGRILICCTAPFDTFFSCFMHSKKTQGERWNNSHCMKRSLFQFYMAMLLLTVILPLHAKQTPHAKPTQQKPNAKPLQQMAAQTVKPKSVAKPQVRVDAAVTSCDPTPILTIPTTISTSGVYCLTQDFTASGTMIVIASNDVCIDLNCHSLNPLDNDAIAFDGVLGRSHITIKNGTLDGSNGGINGINLNSPYFGAFNADLRQHDITISDVLIHYFAQDGITTNTSLSFNTNTGFQDFSPLVSITIRNCEMSSNNNGLLFYNNVDSIIIENCKFILNNVNGAAFSYCGASLCLGFHNTESLSIVNSMFSDNVDGLKLECIYNVGINNCFFTYNTHNGLNINGGNTIGVSECFFGSNAQNGAVIQEGGALCPGDPSISYQSSLNISFMNCLSADNLGENYLIADAVQIKFVGCQSDRAGEHGFVFDASSSADPDAAIHNIILENCSVIGAGIGSGFLLGKGTDFATLLNCISQSHSVGFDFVDSQGSGLVQNCKAENNVKCGFDVPFPLDYQFVSNVAQGNGENPAGSIIPDTVTDTNYCVNTLASYYTPLTGGPGDRAFRQYGKTALNGSYPAGVSAWDNITLP